MFVAGIKTTSRKSAVRGEAAARIGSSKNEIIINFVFTWRDRRAGMLQGLCEVFERRVLTHFDICAVLKVERKMKVDILSLQTPGRIHDIVDLPMRANIANVAVPSPRTPSITGDARKSSNAHARYEAHFIVIVRLDDRVGAAELPHFVLILHRDATGQIFSGKIRRHGLRHETVEA